MKAGKMKGLFTKLDEIVNYLKAVFIEVTLPLDFICVRISAPVLRGDIQ